MDAGPVPPRLQAADCNGLHDRPDLVVETELASRLDFGEFFARLDDPTE